MKRNPYKGIKLSLRALDGAIVSLIVILALIFVRAFH